MRRVATRQRCAPCASFGESPWARSAKSSSWMSSNNDCFCRAHLTDPITRSGPVSALKIRLASMALVQTTPRTASGLFAALALSPGNSPGSPKQLPTLTLFPATPPTADEPLSPLTARQYATHLRESFSKIAHNILPTWDDSPQEPAVRTEDIPVETQSQPVDSTKHRPLASNEARQLSLLLIQHFFPARGNARVMMKESIHLAEMLHEAGVRWDSKRRVMGLHLRGIWEEGQRLTFGSPIGGHGPME